MDIKWRRQQGVIPADPLGEDGWDLSAHPSARLLDPPRVDPALFDLREDDDELEALWEATLSPGAIVVRARAARADALVVELQEIDAEQARLEARKAVVLAALTAAVGGSSENPVHRLDAPSVAASEMAAALRISQRTAKAAVAEALTITAPAWAPLLERMASGDLPRRRANAILEAAAPVPPEGLSTFAAQAVTIACPPDPDQLPSQGTLRRRLRRLAENHAGESLEARKERASAHRRVDLEPAQDGMCWLSAYLPLETGAAIDTRLEAIARSLQGPGEGRTINQLRADALADLLTDAACEGIAGLAPHPGPGCDGTAGLAPHPDAATGSPRPQGPIGGVRTELIVTIPARTILGGSDAPGEIVGHGAIDCEAARLLASEASTWTRLYVDPDTGAPLAIGRRRYTPTLAMRRFLGARDRTCRFPGCDKPAAAVEADHTQEWSEGGATDTNNLALLCREHHRLKTLGHWKVAQIGVEHLPEAPEHRPEGPGGDARRNSAPGDSGSSVPSASPHAPPPPGTLAWTAPSGHRYITYPEGDAPPPF